MTMAKFEPIDALIVINQLNAGRIVTLPSTLSVPIQAYSFIDVDGNNRLQPLDALLIINVLNRQSGLGQGEPAGEPEDQGELLILVGAPTVDMGKEKSFTILLMIRLLTTSTARLNRIRY